MDSVATETHVRVATAKRGGQRRTEWKLLVDAGANHTGVNDEAIGDVVQGQEDRVGEEELHAVRVSATNGRMAGIPSRGCPYDGWRCRRDCRC